MKQLIVIWLIFAFLLTGCSEPIATNDNSALLSSIEESSDMPSATNYNDWLNPQPEINPALMKDKNTVNDWIYFLYPIASDLTPDAYALFRWREDETELMRMSRVRSDAYAIIDDSVYFASFSLTGYEHGTLYVIKPNEEPQFLADELNHYQVVGNYIYYSHSVDTVGVGINGHALHRIDLDGSNHIMAAYRPSGTGIDGSFWGFKVDDDYVYSTNYRMKLGAPADGSERLEILSPSHDGYNGEWIYYATNRLFKARPDGSERTELDGITDYWISVDKVDSDWIYYTIDEKHYKIHKDGTDKTVIDNPYSS